MKSPFMPSPMLLSNVNSSAGQQLKKVVINCMIFLQLFTKGKWASLNQHAAFAVAHVFPHTFLLFY